jgi:hypothetical protein
VAAQPERRIAASAGVGLVKISIIRRLYVGAASLSREYFRAMLGIAVCVFKVDHRSPDDAAKNPPLARDQRTQRYDGESECPLSVPPLSD